MNQKFPRKIGVRTLCCANVPVRRNSSGFILVATLSLLVWVDLALLFSLNRSVQNARMQQEWQWSAELWSAAESGINQQILRWQNMPISLPFPSLRFLFIVDCTNIKGYCTVICEVTGHRRKVRLKAWYSQALKQAVAWQAL